MLLNSRTAPLEIAPVATSIRGRGGIPLTRFAILAGGALAVAHAYAGHSPSAQSLARETIRSGSVLNRSTSTVARPTAVSPSIRPLGSDVKWIDQSSLRGLKRGCRRPSFGSSPTTRVPLYRLHSGHDQARFASLSLAGSSLANRDLGHMCSASNSVAARDGPSGNRQYSQVWLALARASSRSRFGIDGKVRFTWAQTGRYFGREFEHAPEVLSRAVLGELSSCAASVEPVRSALRLPCCLSPVPSVR